MDERKTPLFDFVAFQKRYDQITDLLSAPSIDVKQREQLQREYALLAQILSKHNDIKQLEKEKNELLATKKEIIDHEFSQLISEELQTLTEKINILQEELDLILFPPDEMDNRSVFLEIRAGTGGQEAALFAADLLRMYMLYATRKGWHVAIINESFTDLGGYREVILEIHGKGVYGHLKHEAGVHRVQRVPQTEASGRVHTSTATVVVLPQVEDIDIDIQTSDLRIDVYRASGAGGQHVNTTDSAVRITHIPTGIVVSCQDERSQHKNKAKALKVLRARLFSAKEEERALTMNVKRAEMVGMADRSRKVRTYNVQQDRVTDHIAELTLNNLAAIWEGNIDPLIEARQKKESEERRKEKPRFLL